MDEPRSSATLAAVETLLAALIGGVLAVAGGLVVAVAGDRGERRRWRRDAQLKVNTELLSALQGLMRRMIDVAYLPDKRRGEHPSEVLKAYHEATIAWNSAMYAALLVNPQEVVARIPGLDREVDRLLDQAMAKSWSRTDFRRERRDLGRLAADYLNVARTASGSPKIRLDSVWTWDTDPLAAVDRGY
ncbi:MAG: hypothetical protein LC799_24665 [Actinobacteria bacterium]|nr:hypothetical protein [Actinomycetota bacterium]